MLKKTLLHDGWEFAAPRWLTPPARLGYSRLEWLPAQVPGHVHLDLQRLGVIADPFGGMAELGCQWVDEERWAYRTRFRFRADPALPRRTLRFEGLDTVAMVSLNGEKLADHDQMFVPLELDVSERLRDGDNEVEVLFESALRVGNERRARYLDAEGIPETVVRFDARAFVRKAQYMYGWDWGPRLISAGIYAPVTLVEHRGRITDVHVEQRHRDDGNVELTLSSTHEGEGEVLHFVEGQERVLRDGETLVLEKPALWWPAGLGAQVLLEVTTLLMPPGRASSEPAEQSALDRRVTRVGLRTLRLLREPDAYGESFEFEVNGRRFYALGANYIPDHSFPSAVTRERLRAQLERARDMNMNMLRVWGGGLYESDAFYDIADELGLLVWQDFPYACSYYPEDLASLAAARYEAEVNIKRLRNHASLALWCGNNENRTMRESGWEGAERHPKRYYGERIYADVLPSVLAKLDPGRPYIPSSPWGGAQSNDGGAGDQHYWDVWHGRGDWKHYDDATGRFASEFGFASAPGHATLYRMAPAVPTPLALDPRDRVARFHDKTLKGYETFIGYVELHYPPSRTLEEWSYYSQLNQRDALRHGIEHFRRSQFCRGSLIWQLNDCWPVQSWAVLDFDADYKAAAHELRRLYAPALASLTLDGARARLFTVLDNASEPVTGEAVVEARSLLDGKSLGRWSSQVRLDPGERRLALEVELAGLTPEETILEATFAGTRTHRLLCEPKDARPACARLTVSAVPGGVAVDVDRPVVDLMLYDELGVLRFRDNFVTLAGPGRAILRALGDASEGLLRARSLAGLHELTLENA